MHIQSLFLKVATKTVGKCHFNKTFSFCTFLDDTRMVGFDMDISDQQKKDTQLNLKFFVEMHFLYRIIDQNQ